MGLDPHNYIEVKQYGVLTGTLEQTISGQIHVDDETLTYYPYDSNWSGGTMPLNKYFEVKVKKGLSSPYTQDLQSTYSFYFTSGLHPLYSSYILVRQTGGAFLDNVSIDTINREILHTSLIVQAIASADSLNAWYVTRYVTCKVAYTLLNGFVQSLAVGGYRSKTLGDFTIEANTDIKSAIDPKLQELIDCITRTGNMILTNGVGHPTAVHGVRSRSELLKALPDITRWPVETDRTTAEELIFGDIYKSGGRKKGLF